MAGSSTAMALAPRASLEISTQAWTILKEQCAMLVRSNFLPSSIKTTEQAMAIALKGRELGIPPMQAFAHIHIISGKPTISAELMLALIYQNIPGAKVEIERYEDDGCWIKATRPGHKSVLFKWEMAHAKAADLLAKDNWRKYPRAMFRSRCISEMARSVFPDAIMGCSYTPEELNPDLQVNEDGEVLDVVKASPAVQASLPSPPMRDEDIPFGSQQAPVAAPKPTYDGTEAQQKAIKGLLQQAKVDDVLWDEIDKRMMGQPLTKTRLDQIVKEVCQA